MIHIHHTQLMESGEDFDTCILRCYTGCIENILQKMKICNVVQKGSIIFVIDCLGVMLERSEASQGGVKMDIQTFLHLSRIC